MTVNYTTNLALGQPVTGTESGAWGDDVNNAVTSYLDIAIAGGLAVTVTTADVTLTLTQGTSSATNIGSTTAQYAILNVSGAMTAARNLILPSSSRQYVINNACTGGFLLTVKGSATTGVTLVNGEKAHVFWTGTDYSKLSNTPGGAGTFSSITNTGLTSGRVVYSTTAGLETDSANLTFDGTNLTLLGGTANGVTYLNGSKVLTSGSSLTFDSAGTLTAPQFYQKQNLASAYNTQILENTASNGFAQFNFNIGASGANGVANIGYAPGIFFAIGPTTNDTTTPIVFRNNNASERMRIDSSGDLLVGTTSQLYGAAGARLNVDSGANGGATIKTSGGSSQASIYAFNSATTGDNAFISFGTEGTFTQRGSITYNRAGGLVAYNVTSDYRAKDISGPVTGSGALIDSVPVYMGKMKDATQERPMFIAHETPAYAHTGVKDAVDADGNPVYQQMDASALIPVMWAEIQSLRKRLTALEST